MPAEIATRLLDRFEEVGLVDDGAFARAWVTQRQSATGAARGWPVGPWPGAAPQGCSDDETARGALALVRPRRRPRPVAGASQAAHPARVDDRTATRRLVGLLARKGYPSGLAFAVVRDELGAAGREGLGES